jgi:hypothetical protein
MKAYFANPDYSNANSNPYWEIVNASAQETALNDLTKLSVGTVLSPTSGSTSGYYAANVEDLSRLMKGWSYLTKQSLGARNTGIVSGVPQAQIGETSAYVNDISGFSNGDAFVALEGQKSGYPAFSFNAITTDNGKSEWSSVRNAGLIPTKPFAQDNSNLALAFPNNVNSISTSLEAPQYTDTYGNVNVPTPDNLNGGASNWYVNACGSDEALAQLTNLLPDFTANAGLVSKVVVGTSSTAITLSSANASFAVGQTVTVVTNGSGITTFVSHSLYGNSAVGWYAGKITGISGGNTVITTDLTVAGTTTARALPGTLNQAVVFNGIVSSGNLYQVTVTAFSDPANYGLAVGQTISGAGFTNAIITAITGTGVNAVLTLDTAQTAGSYSSLSAIYTDPFVTAYGATLTNQLVRLNQEANQYDCSYFTTPYYAVPSQVMLGTGLTAGSTVSSLSIYNQDWWGLGSVNTGDKIALVYGDNYQEVTVASGTVFNPATTTTLSVNAFTPNFSFPANSAVYTPTDDLHSRYGRDLIFPVNVAHYRNQPVAKFKNMTPTTIDAYETAYQYTITNITSNGTAWTVTIGTASDSLVVGQKVTIENVTGLTGYNGTWVVATSPSTSSFTIANTNNYGTPSAGQLANAKATLNSKWSNAYTVSVDDVSNIYAGQTLTFRDDYTPYWSSTVPWTWTVTGHTPSIAGVTSVAGSAVLTVSGGGVLNLPIKVGQYISAGGYGTAGHYVTAFTDTTITLDSSSGITTQATPFNIRLTQGTSGQKSWQVYSVNPLNNTFEIFSSVGTYTYSNSSYANGDSKNYIYQYDNQFFDGNTIDTINTTGTGAGVVGLSSPITWHDINTVAGSYLTGGRYIGSTSVGDQEVVIPYSLGSAIGTTLASDITAQTSQAFIANPLPNTAVLGNWSSTDKNQYGNYTFDTLAYAGFANLTPWVIYPNTYDTVQRGIVVIGTGETQEMVRIVRPANTQVNTGTSIGRTVDGSDTTEAPMIWFLDTDQSFQYDHIAGEPVYSPNFIYASASSVNHAKNTPVLGTPDGSNVYDGTTGQTNYKATSAIVASNLTSDLSVIAETQIGVGQPWLASGNQGQPNIATTLTSATIAGGSTLTIADNSGFGTSYPSVFQAGISYLPPELGRLIGSVNSGVTSLPIAMTGEMPPAVPFFVRVGSEIVQVTSIDQQLIAGSTTQYNQVLTLASATQSAHANFTPIHLNSLPTNVRYRSISVPRFYLTGDTSRTGTFSTRNIATSTVPTSLGTGQTVTGTGVPANTTVASHTANGSLGTVTLSNDVTAFVPAGDTFTNKYNYANSQSAQTVINSSRSYTASAGTPAIGVLPSAGSVVTGTGMASPTYLSAVDATNNRITVSANPTSFGSPALTSTLTFTATTTATNTTVTLVSVTSNGTTYSKVGTTNPTWNGHTIDYYIKVQAPITTASGGGIAGRYVASVSASAGTFVVSGTTTGITAATGATITSAIGFTADTGRSIIVPYANNTEIDKLFTTGVTVSDNASNAYIQSGTTITTVQPAGAGGNTYEVLLNKAIATTTPWSSQTVTLSNTFTGTTIVGNTITAMPSVANLTVGAVVSGNPYIPAGATITAVGSSSITLSQNLTNTTPQTSQSFTVAGNLATGNTYNSFSTTPLPCYIPSGTTLNIMFGDYKQTLTTSANANAGDTSIAVNSFVPRYNYLATSTTNGVPVNADGSYALGAVIGVGLANDLSPNQVLILSANSDPTKTLQITTAGYTRKDAITIEVEPFVPNYAFDGQTVGFSFTASTTVFSNTITLSGSVSGLTVGQQVFSNDLIQTQSYFVKSISGTTVVLSGFANTTNASSTFSVYSTLFTSSYPMALGSGTTQEIVYPISTPASANGYYTVNLSEPTVYQHNSGESLVYYKYPSSLQIGDTTYRPELDKFVMFDGQSWRTARINNVQGIYSILGAVNGGDLSNITLIDPTTGKETAPDTFTGSSSTSFSNYFGGSRSVDPSGNEWTAESVSRAQFHFKVKVPQGKSVAYRSIALRAEFKSAPTVSSIHFSPSDNLIISPDTTNSIFWNYSDMDNEPQTGWEVKIFDDFTYNLADFSPDQSTPVWNSSGNDNGSEVSLVLTDANGNTISPWVNGQTYWVFVRVAKQFHQKQWWGDWQNKSLIVTTKQPSAPIMSIYADGTNAVNTLVVQSTDNLLGANNGGFAGGLGQWGVTSNDTTSTTVKALIGGNALSSPLTQNVIINSLPIGSVGYVLTQGALSGTGLGTFKVSGSASKASDALGFPTSGKFWVTIGTEKILVTNNMDGNNNGDTFTIVTRGYKGTTATSHAVGSTVTFGLQDDLYVGSTATIDWKHQVTTNWTTTSPSVVRWSNGGSPAVSAPVNGQLVVYTQTQGADKDNTNHCIVYDPNRLLSKKDIGSTVVLQFNHWRVAGGANQISADGTTVTQTTAKTLDLAHTIGPATVEMVISGVTDVWDTTAHNATTLTAGYTNKQIAGSKSLPVSQLSVNKSLSNLSIQMDSANACVSLNYIPEGTQLILATDSFQDPIKNKTITPPWLYVTLTKAWHKGDSTINIKPIGVAHGWQVGDGSSFIIPANTMIGYKPPVQYTGRKIVHFKGKYTDKKGFSHQKLQNGDYLWVKKTRTTPAVAPTSSGQYTRTVVTPHSKTTDVDTQQSVVVDFVTQPTTATGGVIGNLTGTTFTANTTQSTFNALFFASDPGSVTGSLVTAIGLSPNTTVLGKTSVTGGYAITFSDNTGAQISGATQYSSATGGTGTTPSSPILTNISATFTPYANMVIPAGSTSIPVKPFSPKLSFPAYTPVRFQYPTIFGENVLLADPTTGTGTGTDIAEISTYPTNWSITDQNPILVNAGTTYGLAGFSKVITGTGTPTFAPRIDWYDEIGNLLKSSYGNQSLGANGHTAGATNSVTIGAPLNTTTSAWGQGWTPVAMVATAPLNQVIGTTTNFTSLSTSTGTFTIGGSGVTIPLNAGTVLYNSQGVAFTTTSAVSVNATSVPVRFIDGLVVPTNNTLTISATRAVCSFQWKYANSGDAYGLSGVMFKALTVPTLSANNSVASTEIPTLGTSITVSPNHAVSSFSVPATTPIAGSDSLYVFDPVGDFGTREVHYGSGNNTLWTNTLSAIKAGDTTITLASIAGLGVGSQLTIEYQGSNAETITVSPSWTGGNTVTVSAPGFTKAHASGVRVYSLTAGLGDELQTSQSAGTPVAVFNWGEDGYIGASHSSYTYRIERSEDNGLTWTTLRNGASVIADKSGKATITDYEAIPNKVTYYRATASLTSDPTANNYTIGGVTTQPTLAPNLTSATWWLASTSDDTLRYPMIVKTGYTDTQKHPAGVFYPLGSSRPITLSGIVQGRDGSITVVWTDNANFDNFMSLVNKGETLILTNPVESTRMYIFINQDVSIVHNAAASPYREITINYVEAAPPNFGYTYGS